MNKIDKNNSHWNKERWENEKTNTNKCIAEVEEFINTNKNLSKQKINISTMEDFNIALENKKMIEKLESKKKYLIHLKEKIVKIDSTKLNQNGRKLNGEN